MKSLVLTLALAALPVFSLASELPQDQWVGLRPSVEITVTPTKESGQYEVNATIKDLRSSQIISSPKLLTKAGHAAVIRIGSEAGTRINLSVLVNASESTATYTAEVIEQNETVSSQAATITLQAPAKGG